MAHEADTTKADIKEFYDRISGLERLVARLAADVENLARAVNQNNRPVNFIAIGSLLVAVIAVGGTYVNTRLKPIEDRQEIITTKVLENLKASATLEERTRIYENNLAALRAKDATNEINYINFARETGRLSGVVDRLESELRAIDEYGSSRLTKPKQN